MKSKKKSPWRPISTAPKGEYREVDLWLHIEPSLRSPGMGDSFRGIDAYRKDGKWVHRFKGEEAELDAEYITHWMPIPKGPKIA